MTRPYFHTLFRYATAAGLVGLAVLHSDKVGALVTKSFLAFRNAIGVAP